MWILKTSKIGRKSWLVIEVLISVEDVKNLGMKTRAAEKWRIEEYLNSRRKAYWDLALIEKLTLRGVKGEIRWFVEYEEKNLIGMLKMKAFFVYDEVIKFCAKVFGCCRPCWGWWFKPIWTKCEDSGWILLIESVLLVLLVWTLWPFCWAHEKLEELGEDLRMNTLKFILISVVFFFLVIPWFVLSFVLIILWALSFWILIFLMILLFFWDNSDKNR